MPIQFDAPIFHSFVWGIENECLLMIIEWGLRKGERWIEEWDDRFFEKDGIGEVFGGVGDGGVDFGGGEGVREKLENKLNRICWRAIVETGLISPL